MKHKNISSNFINEEKSFEIDSNYSKIQENLIMMGFDLEMINKIISNFKAKTENEVLDYLIKTEDGMWNHPFIPKNISDNESNKSGILKQPKQLMNSVISKLRFIEISESKQRISKSFNIQNEINLNNFNSNICEICGEEKLFHKKENLSINLNNNENPSLNNNINTNKKTKNILIDEDEQEFNHFNILNNNSYNSNIINSENNNILNQNNQNNQNLILDNEEINYQNECLICMGEIENPLEIENCHHKFCFECFHTYLINLININNIDKISCPKNGCFNTELSEEFFIQYLSQQEFLKYHQFQTQNEIARDRKKIFCPKCNSYAKIEEGIEKLDANNPDYQKSILKCMNGHKFCSCGRPLHENECYKEEKEFNELIKKEKIKRCPKCGFLIKKNKGCNHMTCGNPTCKYEFCWLCMNEALPDHYNFGPCEGRQYLDTDSFQYWMEENCMCLAYFFKFLKILIAIFGLIIIFLVIPGIGLCILSYSLIYEVMNNNDFVNSTIRDLDFIIAIILAFPSQSIVYNFLIIIYYLLINIKYVLIVALFLITIFGIIIICIYLFRRAFISFDHISEDNDEDIIELGNRMNENNI